MKHRGGLLLLLLLLGPGCSQNFSEKGVDEALAEKGMRRMGASSVPPAKSAGGGRKSLGGLSAEVPAEWREVEPATSMRVAEYRLAGAAGEAVLAVFYFGPGQGGTVEANIERWYGQFAQPDGADTRARARQWREEVAGMPVTMVDVGGTFSAGAMSGGDSTPRPDYHMLAAIVESSRGPFFFKLTGPAATVQRWRDDFVRYIRTMQPE